MWSLTNTGCVEGKIWEKDNISIFIFSTITHIVFVPSGSKVVEKCTPTSDAVCKCIDGFTPISKQKQEICFCKIGFEINHRGTHIKSYLTRSHQIAKVHLI